MKRFIAIVLLVIGLVSCGEGRYIYVDRIQHDTIQTMVNRVDTFACVDSVFVDRYRSGDTVYITRDHDRIIYRTRDVHDTLREVHIDTVPQIEEVIPDGYIKPSGWDKFMLGWGNWFFWFTIGVLLALAIRLVIKIYFRK